MTDVVEEAETEEQRKARIAALPRPTASLSMFKLSGVSAQVGGSQIILGAAGDKVTLGVTKGQTLGDDVVSQKVEIASITVSAKRDVRAHKYGTFLRGDDKRTSETKEHIILAGEDKMFGPVREQVTIVDTSLWGADTFIDDENIYITLVSVEDTAGKALEQDKSDPPPPPPKDEPFPWWIVGLGVTVAIIAVIAYYLWTRGRPAVAPLAPAPAPAPAAPVNVTVVK